MTQNPATGSGGDGGAKAGTTFVQADSTCFRDLVQRLTGPSGNQAQAQVQAPVKSPAPKPTQKLHERRKYSKPKIEIAKLGDFQDHQSLQSKMATSPNMLFGGSPQGGFGAFSTSPSSSVMMLSLPNSLQASPISTPVGSSNKRASPSNELELNPGEEEKAIKEKRFYLHPSPRSKPRLAPDPELLTLFPLASPTASSNADKM
ncbi:VQ motif-containing protein 31 [Striga hermonthica]|uniref:VQ motif-containing protein 31 n=1 Tax=Striga hermonthica TaxID=68872 RepID=A0A9N7RN22_STRHE|nr:VQ motif-containing protein 31 [Striga hermonthica]